MVAKVVEIIDVQDYLGQEILNVFHFVDPTGAGDPLVLCSDYVADVLPLIRPVQVTALTHTRLIWRTIFPTVSLALAYTTGLPVAGSNGGVDGDSFEALSVAWTLGAGTVTLVGSGLPHLKRGGCRIGGVANDVSNANNVAGAQVTEIAAWAAELRDPGTDAFLLCVASFLDGARVRQAVAQQYALVTGASAPGASTQNSRKVLRGRTS